MDIYELEQQYSPNRKIPADHTYKGMLEFLLSRDDLSCEEAYAEAEAFWVAPDNTVMPVWDEHYDFAVEECLDELTKENTNKNVKGWWKHGETRNAMHEMFDAGWLRVRRYSRGWDIHGKNIRKKTGKIRWFVNFLLNHNRIKHDSTIVLLNEDEGWWGKNPKYTYTSNEGKRHLASELI